MYNNTSMPVEEEASLDPSVDDDIIRRRNHTRVHDATRMLRSAPSCSPGSSSLGSFCRETHRPHTIGSIISLHTPNLNSTDYAVADCFPS